MAKYITPADISNFAFTQWENLAHEPGGIPVDDLNLAFITIAGAIKARIDESTDSRVKLLDPLGLAVDALNENVRSGMGVVCFHCTGIKLHLIGEDDDGE